MYNEDLYSVEEALNAHTALSEVPEQTAKLVTKLDGTHPNEWQLKLWLGILAEKRGDFDSAGDYYQKSWILANNRNWQPLFRLAVPSKPINTSPRNSGSTWNRPDTQARSRAILLRHA